MSVEQLFSSNITESLFGGLLSCLDPTLPWKINFYFVKWHNIAILNNSCQFYYSKDRQYLAIRPSSDISRRSWLPPEHLTDRYQLRIPWVWVKWYSRRKEYTIMDRVEEFKPKLEEFRELWSILNEELFTHSFIQKKRIMDKLSFAAQ